MPGDFWLELTSERLWFKWLFCSEQAEAREEKKLPMTIWEITVKLRLDPRTVLFPLVQGDEKYQLSVR